MSTFHCCSGGFTLQKAMHFLPCTTFVENQSNRSFVVKIPWHICTPFECYSGRYYECTNGPKNVALLTGWPYYGVGFHDFAAIMTNTPYIAFTELFSLMNNRNVDIGAVQ